jgi:hypothetical protein
VKAHKNELFRTSSRDIMALRAFENMKLPSPTSRLLALREAINAKLCLRLGEIFKRYKSMVFIGRNDHLFTEHWTPELAAAGYDFEGFEIKDADIVLHGVENACGFIYRISISFPLELIDDAVAIDAYFEQKIAESALASATQTGLSNPTAL